MTIPENHVRLDHVLSPYDGPQGLARFSSAIAVRDRASRARPRRTEWRRHASAENHSNEIRSIYDKTHKVASIGMARGRISSAICCVGRDDLSATNTPENGFESRPRRIRVPSGA